MYYLIGWIIANVIVGNKNATGATISSWTNLWKTCKQPMLQSSSCRKGEQLEEFNKKEVPGGGVLRGPVLVNAVVMLVLLAICAKNAMGKSLAATRELRRNGRCLDSGRVDILIDGFYF